jgi:Recombinase
VPQKVIARIKRQRTLGDSLRKIADDLNDRKVPTVYGGKRWYASTVSSVLARTA